MIGVVGFLNVLIVILLIYFNIINTVYYTTIMNEI